jgi:hypothetical protein
MATFHIIYPAGDKTRIQVLELSFAMSHELDDYALASRQEFSDQESASTYGRELARTHGKQFVEEHNGKAQHFLD